MCTGIADAQVICADILVIALVIEFTAARYRKVSAQKGFNTTFVRCARIPVIAVTIFQTASCYRNEHAGVFGADILCTRIEIIAFRRRKAASRSILVEALHIFASVNSAWIVVVAVIICIAASFHRHEHAFSPVCADILGAWISVIAFYFLE
jgi:hypothetical protein